jgi:hypothetical protein
MNRYLNRAKSQGNRKSLVGSTRAVSLPTALAQQAVRIAGQTSELTSPHPPIPVRSNRQRAEQRDAKG